MKRTLQGKALRGFGIHSCEDNGPNHPLSAAPLAARSEVRQLPWPQRCYRTHTQASRSLGAVGVFQEPANPLAELRGVAGQQMFADAPDFFVDEPALVVEFQLNDPIENLAWPCAVR